MGDLTVEDLRKIFANPFYAITLSEGLFGEHETIITKEQWVQANVKGIEEEGSEAWLKRLLDVLEGNFVQSAK